MLLQSLRTVLKQRKPLVNFECQKTWVDLT